MFFLNARRQMVAELVEIFALAFEVLLLTLTVNGKELIEVGL